MHDSLASASWSAATRTGVETALTLFVVALLAATTGVFGRLDNLLYDTALSLHRRPAPPDIVIVAIDERSLAEFGRWPWSRRLHASLIDRLTAVGAAVIAFDVFFTEPQTGDPGADAELARAVAAHGHVVLPVYPRVDSQAGGIREVLPMLPLQQAAAALGHVDVELDADAIARRVFLYAGQGAPRWPAFALAAVEVGRGHRQSISAADADAGAARWIRKSELLVPFTGGGGHFNRVSVLDVLRDVRVADSLRGKIVLIGATAAGLQREFATPVSGLGQPLSGVELQANVLETLRQGLGITPFDWPWQMLLAVVPLLLAVLAYARAGVRSALLVTVALLALVAAAVFVLLHGAQRWLPPTPALLAVLLSYPLYAWRRIERTARSLAAEEQKGRATLHAIGDAVITTDRGGRITFANPLAERISGLSNERMHDRPVAEMLQFANEEDRNRFASVLEHCARSAASASLVGQLTLLSAQGELHDVRVSASPVRLPGGHFDGIVLAMTDISENVAMTRRISHQATHDSLTGLPNRTLVADRLEHALGAARRSNTLVAVLFLDLDNFKRVNDGFGHAVGDQLLIEVGQRLSAGSRANDTVARWGGDEFLVVAEELPSAEAAALVARKLLDRFMAPLTANGNELHITGSIGISVFPRDGLDPQTLVENADRAMYRAKHLGRNQVQFFSESINQRAHERREIEAGLRWAITRNELELHFQPQVTLDHSVLVGAEVLLRWRHPQAGLLLPDRFISVAEECGLIHDIGAWVLRAACRIAAAWHDAGMPSVALSINVSPRQLLGQELTTILRNALIDTGLNPAAIVLEITESAMMQDIDRVAAMLHDIRSLGVRISIDDFGTGYSSLSLLQRLPVEQIKIDRSFVRNVIDDANDASITRGVIALAKSMRINVVAEGVETAAQLAFLLEHKCDAAQGYYISPPLAEAEFSALLQALRAPRATPPPGTLAERLLGGLHADISFARQTRN